MNGRTRVEVGGVGAVTGFFPSPERAGTAQLYEVEQGHLASNPVDRIQWTTPAVAQTVDRRVVFSPAQARNLLAAVRSVSGRGQHLEAFYACLYYAALRRRKQ